MDSWKLLVLLAAIVLGLRRNLTVGITLFGAGLLTALLYGVDSGRLIEGYWDLVRSERFLSITGVIILITVMGSLLKELGFLEKLAVACSHLYGGARTAVAVLPFLIGLMPMPGGALLSAPLVDNVLKGSQYSAEFKCAANYWFRHVVEFFWPVYPGIILSAGMTGMSLSRIMLLQLPLTIIMIGLGALFFSRRVEIDRHNHVQMWRSLKGVLFTIWPIGLAILIFAITRINLVYAVFVSLVAVVIVTRPARAKLIYSFRQGLSYKLVFMVFGILSFQTILDLSGAVESIPGLTASLHLSPQVLIAIVCFVAGLLTGMVAAYVGMCYSLLAGLLYQPSLLPGNILLAYLSGYIGMLLSPTHLCLVVTSGYFRANLLGVYRIILFPVILLCLLGYILSRSGWPSMFL
ncbi:MAG: DUF401 family protein [Candidatus Zixiibacteriota bacterium]